MKNWKQIGNTLWLRDKIFFEMPKGFEISKTHPDLLKLSEYLLVSPWENNFLDGYEFSRQKGGRIGLSFSTGKDSSAAKLLLPDDTVLGYNQRKSDLPTMLNQSNAFATLERIRKEEPKRDLFSIKSNQEEYRTYHNLPVGYSTDLCVLIPCILMADYYSFGFLATGTILESAYMGKGKYFRDFGKINYTNLYYELFLKAGLELVFPVAGISEVLTYKIVGNSYLGKLSQSCIRGKLGEVCGKCPKCFRNGDAIYPLSEEIKKSIKNHKLWASLAYRLMKDKKWHGEIPVDVGFLDKGYYPPFLKHCGELAPGIRKKLHALGINAMKNEQISQLESFVS